MIRKILLMAISLMFLHYQGLACLCNCDNPDPCPFTEEEIIAYVKEILIKAFNSDVIKPYLYLTTDGKSYPLVISFPDEYPDGIFILDIEIAGKAVSIMTKSQADSSNLRSYYFLNEIQIYKDGISYGMSLWIDDPVRDIFYSPSFSYTIDNKEWHLIDSYIKVKHYNPNQKESYGGLPIKNIIYGQILNFCIEKANEQKLLSESSKIFPNQLVLVDSSFLAYGWQPPLDSLRVPISFASKLDSAWGDLESYFEVIDFTYLGDLAMMEIRNPTKKVLIGVTCKKSKEGIWQKNTEYIKYY